MKTVLLIVAISFGLISKANHLNSELHLKMQECGPFTIQMDNQSYFTNDCKITFWNLDPGNHMLLITKPAPVMYGHCGMPLVIFNCCIDVPVNSKIYAIINCYHQYQVMSVCPLYVEPVYDYGHGNNSCGNTGYGYNTGYCAPVCMSEPAFQQLLFSIDSKAFDSSRLVVAKQALSMNYVSAVQVSRLMDLMTFESTKLELAKFAYKRTIDKQNYYMVNDAFTFESSISSLEYYISHC